MRKLLAAAALVAMFVPALAQQSDLSPAGDATVTDAPKPFLLDVSDARARTGRVPNGYGRLSLTRAQKERIYGIQAAYDERIKELEAELEQLKEEEVTQIKNVLTDSQKVQIERYEADLEARRASR